MIILAAALALRLMNPDAECGNTAMAVPLFACKHGYTTAFVPPVDGASYTWTAEGAAIVGAANTNRVLVQLSDAATAKLSCVITTSDCTITASGVIAVRDPIVIKTFNVPASADANQPLTITWSYEQEPASQFLSGDVLAAPVTLDPAQRSYTFTPHSSGTRTIELRASYAREIAAAPAKKRRTSGGGAPAASECPSARAEAKIDIRGCTAAPAVLDLPEDVAAGATFEALVDAGDGQHVDWSVENGAIQYASPFGERVLVVAGATGEVHVSARVERAPGCFSSAEANVAIILPASQCAIPPNALLSLVSHDCERAIVRAAFTGTPPFGGRWSDGESFRTSASYAIHEFRSAGQYGISDFHDGSCFGAVSGSPSLEQLRPAVKFEGTVSCATAHLVATLKGVPPFTGTWSDGQSFTTSDAQIERTVGPGTWSITSMSDALCAARSIGGVVRVEPPPKVTIPQPGEFCAYSTGYTVGALFSGGAPPYRIEWGNGVIGTESTYNYVLTRFPFVSEQIRTYEMQHAYANGCPAELDPQPITIYSRNIAYHNGPYHEPLCVGTNVTVSLQQFPSPGGSYQWKLTGGRIVSGTGSTLTFTSDEPGFAALSVDTTYPDGHCNASTNPYSVPFTNPRMVTNIALTPSTIAPYGTAKLSFAVTHDQLQPKVSVPDSRKANFRMEGCCTGTYIDSGVPGTVPITIQWTDPCSGPHSETVNLTITP